MRKLYLIFKGFNQKLRNDDISAYASSIAFFLFLSLIPILLIICAVLPYTPLSEADLMRIVIDITPASVDPMVVSLVSQVYDKSKGILSVAIVITIWSAGKGMLALMRGLNVTHGVEEERGYFRLRILASFYTIMVLLLILINLILGVFGNHVLHFFMSHFPILKNVFFFFEEFRILLVLLLMVLAFTLIYTYIPNKKLKIRQQIPGAVFVAVAWNICSFGFSIYVDHFNMFSAYGTLGTIILFLLWLYFCSYIMLIGANVNLYFKSMIQYLTGKREF